MILFQITDLFAVTDGILDFRAGTLTDIAAHIDDIDGVRHVNLPLVHVVEHLLRVARPDFLVSGVAEEAHADDDVAFEGEAFLRFDELILEAGAAAQGDYGELSYHKTVIKRLFFMPDNSSQLSNCHKVHQTLDLDEHFSRPFIFFLQESKMARIFIFDVCNCFSKLVKVNI